MKILNERGILIAIADDFKMCTPHSVLAEIVGKLPALAMSEAGLTSQATNNREYVQSIARAVWIAYLDANPRSEDTNTLSLHDIPDSRLPDLDELDDGFYAPHQGPSGLNLTGLTPSGPRSDRLPSWNSTYIANSRSTYSFCLSSRMSSRSDI
jgi:hypothetical protein